MSCPNDVLLPGQSATCSGSGIAVEGQYANLATARAPHPAGGPELTASDPSHYFGSEPDLELEKSTNGEDADDPTGPYIEVSDPVNWTYEVTNSGNVTVDDLVVLDSQLPLDAVNCPETTLAPGESTTCTADGTASPGQYTNLGFALARGPGGPVDFVGALDPSHYFGADGAIRIEKLTNGLDADTPEAAAVIGIGAPVEWYYEVSNTGNTPLSNVTVTDDRGVTPVFTGGDDNNNGLLDIGEFWTYEAQGIAEEGDYVNIGTARGTDEANQLLEPLAAKGHEGQVDVCHILLNSNAFRFVD